LERGGKLYRTLTFSKLLSPPQRTARAGRLFAAALALALIRSGWELQRQPAVFHLRRGDQELNPFEVIDELMTGKLSREAGSVRCREFELSQLILFPADGAYDPPPPESCARLELSR
jgi:hypothetical protein